MKNRLNFFSACGYRNLRVKLGTVIAILCLEKNQPKTTRKTLRIEELKDCINLLPNDTSGSLTQPTMKFASL